MDAKSTRELARAQMESYSHGLHNKVKTLKSEPSVGVEGQVDGKHAVRYIMHRAPLDFSFCELRSLSEMRAVAPRSGPKRVLQWLEGTREKEKREGKGKRGEDDAASKAGSDAGTEVPAPAGSDVDAGAGEMDGASTARGARARPGDIAVPTAVRLNNNSLTSLAGEVLRPSFEFVLRTKFGALKWLDLSFNKIAVLDKALVECCPKLTLLNLHANEITDFRQVQVLAGLEELTSLTLHGNEIENAPKYRFRVCCIASKTLRSLDFSPLTLIDKDNASTWASSQTPRGIRTPR